MVLSSAILIVVTGLSGVTGDSRLPDLAGVFLFVIFGQVVELNYELRWWLVNTKKNYYTIMYARFFQVLNMSKAYQYVCLGKLKNRGGF